MHGKSLLGVATPQDAGSKLQAGSLLLRHARQWQQQCARIATEMGGLLNTLTRLDFYRKPAAFRYGLALVFTLAALGANSLPPAGQNTPFLFFCGAVALTARFCGFGPALLVTAISGFCADYFFLKPFFNVRFTSTSAIQLFLFVMVSLIITSVALQKSAAETAAQWSQSR